MLYVDRLFLAQPQGKTKKYGNTWCHLWIANFPPDSLEELHSFAQKIGLKKAYFQHHKLWFPHYDLTPAKRVLAIKQGAIEKDLYEWVKEQGGLKALNQQKGDTIHDLRHP
jgi:hypothetical protein